MIEHPPTTQDFAEFVEQLAEFTRLDSELAALELTVNKAAQKCAVDRAPDYVLLQEARTRSEERVKALYAAHPEWRGKSKSVSTPLGEVAERETTTLEIPNPAVTVTLIKAAAATFGRQPKDLLHVEESPNKEALEGMTDDQLKALGVARVTRTSVSVKARKVDVKKAALKGKEEAK